MNISEKKLNEHIQKAVALYWETRFKQSKKQKKEPKADSGARTAVTGGAQMDGFIELFSSMINDIGVPQSCIFHKKALDLPGFFRPTKEWDLLVIKDERLIAVIETKSQVGPSFGNNFNNRTEEAMGSALDLWTAFREGAYQKSSQPFVGYFFMLEECEQSNKPVKVREPHFKVFPEFVDASYMKRYEHLCRKLVLERHYTATSFICSRKDSGLKGLFSIPEPELSPIHFVKNLIGHILAGC